jgi:hypothetical protein
VTLLPPERAKALLLIFPSLMIPCAQHECIMSKALQMKKGRSPLHDLPFLFLVGRRGVEPRTN